MPKSPNKCTCTCMWCAETNPPAHDICGFDCALSAEKPKKKSIDEMFDVEFALSSEGKESLFHQLKDYDRAKSFLLQEVEKARKEGYEQGINEADWMGEKLIDAVESGRKQERKRLSEAFDEHFPFKIEKVEGASCTPIKEEIKRFIRG